MDTVAADVYGWSGYEIMCHDLVLGLVPALGGRIMSLKFRGEELFYVPEQGRGSLPQLPAGDIADLAAFKRGFGFPIFGGDKTWVAPEKEWLEKTPSVDLDAGAYAYEEDGGASVMISPVCRETGLQIVRRVGALATGDIVLVETLRNRNAHAVTKGIWNVTQILRPFEAHLPAEPAQVRSYYHEDPTLPDPGIVPSKKGAMAVVPCEAPVCFKFGAMLREGRVMVHKPAHQGPVVMTRVFNIAPNKAYAHRSMAEVFNSAQHPYGEIEVHSPLSLIPAGGEISMTQFWRVRAC
jgi:hypothetical protein